MERDFKRKMQHLLLFKFYVNLSEFIFIFNLILSFKNATVDIDSEEEKKKYPS